MNEVDNFFEAREWQRLHEAGALTFYANDYAALGIALVATANEISAGWIGWQSALLQLRKQSGVGDRRDLYLVIVLEDEDPDVLMGLQPIIDDTHICRKIILVQRGGSLTDTLKEEALFQAASENMVIDEKPSPANAVTLDSQVINDLAKKGIPAIFERLLAGQYRRTDET